MPDAPPVNQIIRGKNEASPAFREALADMVKWSDGVRANVNEAKRAVGGFKETLEFAQQAMRGFGAVAIARDLYGVAADAWAAAEGMAQFVIDAREAGAAVSDLALQDALALKGELAALKTEVMGIGAAVLGNFLPDMRTATAGIKELLAPLQQWVSYARTAAEIARSLGQLDPVGAIGHGALGALDMALPVGGTVNGGDDDEFDDASFDRFMGKGGKSTDKVIADEQRDKDKIARDKERKEAALLRDAEHKRRQQEQEAKHRADELARDEKANQQRLKSEQDAARRAADDRKRNYQDRKRQQEDMLNTGAQALSMFFSKSKGVAIAEALVNTYTGVSAALRYGPKGIPMAALVLAQGLQNVQRIKSTNEGTGGGGAGGGGPSGGGAAPVEAPAPIETARTMPQRGNLEIHLIGNVMTPEFTRESLIPELRKAGLDGYDIGVFDERGKARKRVG